MTHGIGFDRSYWDLPVQDYNYSYVARAVDEHGYSTLTWDRLGVGESSHGETINEIQIFLEIAALKELTEIFASGKACGVEHHGYDKIVHLGHSFGSAMTYGLVLENPDISAGIVLTGFSQIPNYMGLFALGGNFVPVSSIPSLVDGYPEGYVSAGTRMGVQINFFAPGDFDEELLDHLFDNGRPNTPGEILTVGFGGDKSNPFPGPAMVITGGKSHLSSFGYRSKGVFLLTQCRARCPLLRRRLLRNIRHQQRRPRPHRHIEPFLPQRLHLQLDRRPRGWSWPLCRLLCLFCL